MNLPDLSQYVKHLLEFCSSAPDRHVAMLKAHYRAPGRKITATALAHAAGYSTYSAANVQYGKFAHRLCDSLHFSPPIGNSGKPTFTYVLASPSKLSSADWEWTMHDVVALAIEQSNIFSSGTAATDSAPVYPGDVTDVSTYAEGATLQVTVNLFERSRTARDACIAYWGSICSVCKLDFQLTYGADSNRCIHVHHLKPLSSLRSAQEVNPVNDLRPVCPNCHTVLHTTKPPTSIGELRRRLRRKKDD